MKIVVIKPQDGKCQLCGKVEDLRPYGPEGKFVCFDCGMKDEANALKMFEELTKGALTIIDATETHGAMLLIDGLPEDPTSPAN